MIFSTYYTKIIWQGDNHDSLNPDCDLDIEADKSTLTYSIELRSKTHSKSVILALLILVYNKRSGFDTACKFYRSWNKFLSPYLSTTDGLGDSSAIWRGVIVFYFCRFSSPNLIKKLFHGDKRFQTTDCEMKTFNFINNRIIKGYWPLN